MSEYTACTSIYVLSCTILEQEQLLNLMHGWDKCDLRDAMFSYLTEDANLIYLTCRVGQWLVDTYHIGRLALS